MKKIKIFLKKLLFIIALWILRKRVKSANKIYVFDIDNTLANSFPYIQNKQIYPKNLPYFVKIRDDIKYKINSGYLIFFATVRPLKYYFDTLKWLAKLGIPIGKKQLLFFSSPCQKIEFIELLLKINKSVKLYDDMSFNHENGNVIFYENELNKIKAIGLDYVGYDGLKKYQSIISEL